MSSLAPQAVRVRTSAGWRDVALMGPPGPGGLLDAQRIQGQYAGYQGPNSIAASPIQLYCDAAATIPLRISYTPPVDAWWDVALNIGIVQKMDANYHYCYGTLQINPADADGIQNAQHLVTQHASVNQYEGRLIRRLFKLSAGVAYRVDGLLGPANAGGSWSSYSGGDTLWLDARAWVRGTVLPLGVPQYVTSLPATPYDGQEIYYSPVAGVIWHLRYNAASASAYKWECLGGSPLEAAVAADNTFVINSTWVDAANGPIVTVPRAGDYDVLAQCDLYSSGQAAAGQLQAGLIASSGTWDAIAGTGVSPFYIGYAAAGSASGAGGGETIRGIAANGTIKMQYQAPSAVGGTGHCRWRLLKVMPIRIG